MNALCFGLVCLRDCFIVLAVLLTAHMLLNEKGE